MRSKLRLKQQAEPPRQALFRRTNRAPGDSAALVRLRPALQERLPRQPAPAGVAHDVLHRPCNGVNAGCLQLGKLDQTSPAQLLAQIIRHQPVHAVDGWDDLRRRRQPDRRCFAVFRRQRPLDVLIVVEVALVPEMAGATCLRGLRGVLLGNCLCHDRCVQGRMVHARALSALL